MDGRFDLPEPHGTCYLAVDPMAALLELLGPERTGVISAKFLEERRIRELQLPRESAVADVTSRKASAFGITAEIGTLLPYDRPQAWALRLHQANFHGIFYWLRHDPSTTLQGRRGWPCSGLMGNAGVGGVDGNASSQKS
jgi:hypothetical protein